MNLDEVRVFDFAYSSFWDSFGDAVHFTARAGDVSPHQTARFARVAILASALSLECAANRCLDSLQLPGQEHDDFDKLPPLGKFQVFVAIKANGNLLKRGDTTVQSVAELNKIRNDIVHPKKRRASFVNGEGGYRLDFGVYPHMKIPRLTPKWSQQDALTVLRAIVDFYRYCFKTTCGMTSNEIGDVLFSRMTTDPPAVFNSWGNVWDETLSEAEGRWKLDLSIFRFSIKSNVPPGEKSI